MPPADAPDAATTAGAPTVREVPGLLVPADQAAVRRIVDDATDADGATPLDEHVLLHLRHGGDERGLSLLVDLDGMTVGYAHLDLTDEVSGASAQLVVAPAYRGHGIGRGLVGELVHRAPGGRLRLWAHGERSDVIRMVAPLGFRRSRTLLQMRRSLMAPLPAPREVPGVTIRTFRPGTDDEALVALNAAAFAAHPEQGGWTLADLHSRMAESWFDPAGFFLAERDGRLVGFHWTKVHGGASGNGHGHDPVGEVYVVGVHPAEQGTGLGRALTLVGLRHLRSLGLAQVMLYVDGDNAAATRLYGSLGFTPWDTDVMYERV